MFLYDGFGGTSYFGIFFAIVTIVVVGTIVFRAVSGIKTWNKNNQSPRLTVAAKIVSKRTEVTHHNHTNGDAGVTTTTSTRYFVTFQVESGDRMELAVKGREYGMLSEGDTGMLTFQGTRYLSFERSENY